MGCSYTRSSNVASSAHRLHAGKPASTGKPQAPRTPGSLQQQWDLARASANNARHVKLEHMCTQCFGRMLSVRAQCRFCSASMAQALTIVVPGQWPPIGATKSMLSRYEPNLAAATSKEPAQAQVPEVQMHDAQDSPQAKERPLQLLIAAQLRQEIVRLEKHILDLPQEGYGSLRDTLEDNLSATRTELLARQPSGQALDQAVARHKQAAKTLQIAEQSLSKEKESLHLAEVAYEQTKQAEETAAREVIKQRSAISEFEAVSAVPRPMPSNTIVGLYRVNWVHFWETFGGTPTPPF